MVVAALAAWSAAAWWQRRLPGDPWDAAMRRAQAEAASRARVRMLAGPGTGTGGAGAAAP